LYKVIIEHRSILFPVVPAYLAVAKSAEGAAAAAAEAEETIA
jgi:hypothetical protein